MRRVAFFIAFARIYGLFKQKIIVFKFHALNVTGGFIVVVSRMVFSVRRHHRHMSCHQCQYLENDGDA